MNTADQVLYLLKTRGAQTAQTLADLLDLTSMGARRQLEAAQEKGLVEYDDVSDKVGRPSRRWHLTATGHGRFPDRHADLTLQMIQQVRTLFGEEGLEKLIAAREKECEAIYRTAVHKADSLDGDTLLAGKVAALAQARDVEGYMAESTVLQDGSVLLMENHCPICAAATACQGFCRSELQVFQRVLGNDCTVERTEHVLAGARRCVYRIRPVR